MSGTKRVGRPMKNNIKVEVSNLIVEFLSRKKHDYNPEICYMKVIDEDVKEKKSKLMFWLIKEY